MTAYAVEVNEGTIEITRRGSDYWNQHRPMFVAGGKLTETTVPCIVGGKVELGPYEHEDAVFMAEHLVASGVPTSAVKVVKRAEVRRDAS